MLKKLSGIAVLCVLALPMVGGTITGFQSYAPTLSGGTLANFEGFSEGTIITTQYAGMTFSQTGGGAPMIDNYNGSSSVPDCSGEAWCFGYGASSGSGVLTGSAEGSYYITTAGIIVTFSSLQSEVQAFLSDTAPYGNYAVTAYSGPGATGTLLGTVTVLQANTLPPGYSGGYYPAPGTFPLPGIYVGFTDSVAEIGSIQIGPSSAAYDAFAVDDVSFAPEPGTLLLLSASLLGLGVAKLRRSRR
jgi:hypothetical protein